MKLYVWEQFVPDYTDGLAVALADSHEEAERLVMEKMCRHDNDGFGRVTVYELDEPIAFAVSGGG